MTDTDEYDDGTEEQAPGQLPYDEQLKIYKMLRRTHNAEQPHKLREKQKRRAANKQARKNRKQNRRK
jgi:hypothetical protein